MDANLNNGDVEITMCESKPLWLAPEMVFLSGLDAESGAVVSVFENTNGTFQSS